MFELIYTIIRPRRKPKTLVWRSKDGDFPVTLVGVAGKAQGVEFSQVLFEGRTSYVPSHELFYV